MTTIAQFCLVRFCLTDGDGGPLLAEVGLSPEVLARFVADAHGWTESDWEFFKEYWDKFAQEDPACTTMLGRRVARTAGFETDDVVWHGVVYTACMVGYINLFVDSVRDPKL